MNQSINKAAAQAAELTLPFATPPVAKINPFSHLDAVQDLESLKKFQYSLFYDWKHHL